MFGPSRRVARRTARRTSRRQAMFRDMEAYDDESEQAPQYAPPAPQAPDYTEELEKLARLRDQGVVSAEEFETKKKQILGI